MTKVLLEFQLTRPLDETLMQRIADAHGHYGIVRIRVAPTLDSISVEYDASRMTPDQVESRLRQAGIPATPSQ
jgi:hypothetical protein